MVGNFNQSNIFVKFHNCGANRAKTYFLHDRTEQIMVPNTILLILYKKAFSAQRAKDLW